jgi:hypothetical protein
LAGDELSGGVNSQFSLDAPPGEYDELEFEVHKLSGEPVPTDAAMKEMYDRNACIMVNGTIDGAPFEFASEVDEKHELLGWFVLEPGADNVTLNIDPAGWFLDGTTRVDPRNPEMRSRIEANIKSSISALEDDNLDGSEDD